MAEFALQIVADSKGAVKEIRSVSNETDKLGKKSKSLTGRRQRARVTPT